MAISLRQSTASQEIPLGPFLDSTDGDSVEGSLTIANTDIKLWRTGATTLADKTSGGATHISGGIYFTVLDAIDTATLGPLVVFVHVAGALAVRVECVVLTAANYDALAGIGVPDVNVVSISGDTAAADNLEAALDGTGFNVGAGAIVVSSVTGTPTAEEIADAVWDEDLAVGHGTAGSAAVVLDARATQASVDGLNNFNPATETVNANVQQINDVPLIGDGSTTPFGV